MDVQSKPIIDPKTLGTELRERRKRLGLTLEALSSSAKIDVGQLSRLETGQMVRWGKNLQKLVVTLQNLEAATSPVEATDIVGRFTAVVRRSDRHAAAASALVDALERLM